eukprot:4057723-Heterocapsa_arctica.AAC.1
MSIDGLMRRNIECGFGGASTKALRVSCEGSFASRLQTTASLFSLSLIARKFVEQLLEDSALANALKPSQT